MAIQDQLTPESQEQMPQEGAPQEGANMAPQEGATPESSEGVMGTAQKVAQGQEQELDPKLQKELQGWKVLLDKLMHSKKTRGLTMDLLKAGKGDPELAIPNAALTIQKQAEAMSKKSGRKISTDAKVAGGVYLVTDLLELGKAAGMWEDPDEQTTGLILQDTLQDYVEAGLADGSIDPIELQAQTEPLMSPEQRQMGAAYGLKAGMPAKPNDMMMAHASSQRGTKRKETMAAQRKAPQGQAPQGQPQQAPPQQGGGVLGGQ